MFVRKKKLEELEKRVLEAERELAYQGERVRLLQERCERLERRIAAQINDFEKKICGLKATLVAYVDKQFEKERVQIQSDEKEGEAPTVAQVMDEWLNGKKEGEK